MDRGPGDVCIEDPYAHRSSSPHIIVLGYGYQGKGRRSVCPLPSLARVLGLSMPIPLPLASLLLFPSPFLPLPKCFPCSATCVLASSLPQIDTKQVCKVIGANTSVTDRRLHEMRRSLLQAGKELNLIGNSSQLPKLRATQQLQLATVIRHMHLLVGKKPPQQQTVLPGSSSKRKRLLPSLFGVVEELLGLEDSPHPSAGEGEPRRNAAAFHLRARQRINEARTRRKHKLCAAKLRLAGLGLEALPASSKGLDCEDLLIQELVEKGCSDSVILEGQYRSWLEGGDGEGGDHEVNDQEIQTYLCSSEEIDIRARVAGCSGM